VTLREEGTSTR